MYPYFHDDGVSSMTIGEILQAFGGGSEAMEEASLKLRQWAEATEEAKDWLSPSDQPAIQTMDNLSDKEFEELLQTGIKHGQ